MSMKLFFRGFVAAAVLISTATVAAPRAVQSAPYLPDQGRFIPSADGFAVAVRQWGHGK